MIPFLAEALCFPKFIREDIDNLYRSKKYEFYEFATKSEYYNSIMATESSLLSDEYFRKCIGILEYHKMHADDSEVEDKIARLLKKGYKKTFSFFKNRCNKDNMDFKDCASFIYGYANNMSDHELSCNFIVAVLFSTQYETVTNREPILKLLYERLQHYDGVGRFSISKMNITEESMIKELKKELPKDIINYVMEAQLDKSSPYLFLYDLEGISPLSLFSEIKLHENDLDEVLATYICGTKELLGEKLIHYIIPALHIMALLKSYRNVKDMYFKHNKETMYVEFNRLEEDLSRTKELLKAEIAKQNFEKSSQEEALSILQEENSRLKKLLVEKDEFVKQIERERIELISLRNYAFNNSDSEVLPAINNTSTTSLNALSGIVIGGHSSWQNKLKERLPDWKFIGTDSLNFDTNIISNCDIVVINTSYLSHSMYYKVIDKVKNNNKQLLYVSSTNIQQVLQEVLITLS